MSKLPPHTSRADFEAAMRRFDAEFRTQAAWATWPTRADKWAVAHNGRHYPVKFLIHLATGEELRAFDGGREANAYVLRRDLALVRLQPEAAPPSYQGYPIAALDLGTDGPAGQPVRAECQEGQWRITVGGQPPAGDGCRFATLDEVLTFWRRLSHTAP